MLLLFLMQDNATVVVVLWTSPSYRSDFVLYPSDLSSHPLDLASHFSPLEIIKTQKCLLRLELCFQT